MEDEVGLADVTIRENFIERIFCYRRWQDLIASGLTQRKLLSFHSSHRLTLMAHGSGHSRQLQRVVTHAPTKSLRQRARLYATGFMGALKRHATRRRHGQVLLYVLGQLDGKLNRGDVGELRAAIDDYRLPRVPWIVPVTLLNHHLRHYPHPDITNQVYLKPGAQELLLRYHT